MRFTRIARRFVVYMGACIVFSVLAHAQDSTASRFEAGAAFTTIHNINLPGMAGPGGEGDINFGNHLALDASFNWLPASASQTGEFAGRGEGRNTG